jgi:hypothetical protein
MIFIFINMRRLYKPKPRSSLFYSNPWLGLVLCLPCCSIFISITESRSGYDNNKDIYAFCAAVVVSRGKKSGKSGG